MSCESERAEPSRAITRLPKVPASTVRPFGESATAPTAPSMRAGEQPVLRRGGRRPSGCLSQGPGRARARSRGRTTGLGNRRPRPSGRRARWRSRRPADPRCRLRTTGAGAACRSRPWPRGGACAGQRRHKPRRLVAGEREDDAMVLGRRRRHVQVPAVRRDHESGRIEQERSHSGAGRGVGSTDAADLAERPSAVPDREDRHLLRPFACGEIAEAAVRRDGERAGGRSFRPGCTQRSQFPRRGRREDGGRRCSGNGRRARRADVKSQEARKTLVPLRPTTSAVGPLIAPPRVHRGSLRAMQPALPGRRVSVPVLARL